MAIMPLTDDFDVFEKFRRLNWQKVPAEGFEPPTLCSEDRCSGPLS